MSKNEPKKKTDLSGLDNQSIEERVKIEAVFEELDKGEVIKHVKLSEEDKAKIDKIGNFIAESLTQGARDKQLVEDYLETSEGFKAVLELATAWKKNRGQTFEEALAILDHNEKIMKEIFGDHLVTSISEPIGEKDRSTTSLPNANAGKGSTLTLDEVEKLPKKVSKN